jgi:hypothetical protein
MGKKILFFYWLVIVVFLLSIGLGRGRAIEVWEDNLYVDGYWRYQLVLHTGTQNPINDDNHKFTLSRATFQTEWEYTPIDELKFYSKIKLMHDQTDGMNADSYDAFPRTAPSELKIAGNDEYQFEATELYGDINVGNFFLRAGRQQIVWGEMIGARIMDLINPLDISWHGRYEPEEFENIRVAQWAIRGIYQIEQNIIPWMWNTNIEAFVNPGDVSPQLIRWSTLSDDRDNSGAPFNAINYAFPFEINEKDRRGDTEFGVRFGFNIGQFYATLNYMHLYNDDALLSGRTVSVAQPGAPPTSTTIIDRVYPLTDIYGITVNYAFNEPINIALTFEGTYSPNQPYSDRLNAFSIRDAGTFNYAIRAVRKTFIVPYSFYYASAMDIFLQFVQKVVEGDPDEIWGPGVGQRMERTQEIISVQLVQPFLKGNELKLQFRILYDLDDAYSVQPLVTRKFGDHWYFDLMGNFMGGSEKRTLRFGSFDWQDEVMFRATYQF